MIAMIKPFDPLGSLPRTMTSTSAMDAPKAGKLPFALTVRTPGGGVLRTDVERSTAFKVAEILSEVEPRMRSHVIRKLKRQLLDQRREHTVKLADVENQIASAKAAHDLFGEFSAWTKPPGINIERAEGSKAHHLLGAIRRASIATVRVSADDVARVVVAGLDEEPPIGQVFVVEHDWAAAFAGAKDYSASGEYRLPYEACCFDFRFSGKHVCALAQNRHGEPAICIFVEIKTIPGAWLGIDTHEIWKPIVRAVLDQVQAICVSLEAEVAATDVIRAPYRLNEARVRAGKLPVFDHHVVKLARQRRYAPLPTGEAEGGRRRRLHFRRGHWRHYQSHKTYIKWMLVGDPDLGFVDKEYRL
ncbi:MAG TPA: hypothetical protein VIU44_07755 [Gaiellaceae bacterium]